MLKGIGDDIGEYIKLLEGTRNGYYVSYARIYIYLDVSGVLPDTIKLVFKDEVWLHNIDYEHIPFSCKKCHENGHLFKECS